MGIAEYLDQHEMHDNHKKVIKDIDTYLSEQSERKLQNEDFEGYKGGVKQLTHDLYNRGFSVFHEHKAAIENMSDADKKKHMGKMTQKLLDELVVETIGKLEGNSDAVNAAKLYKIRRDNGMYDGDTGEQKRQQKIFQLAKEHLGLSEKEFPNLAQGILQALQSGDESIYREAMSEWQDALGKNMHKSRIAKIVNTLNSDEEARVSANVHYWKQIRDEHGAVPENIQQIYESDPTEVRNLKSQLTGFKKQKEISVEDLLKKYNLKATEQQS